MLFNWVHLAVLLCCIACNNFELDRTLHLSISDMAFIASMNTFDTFGHMNMDDVKAPDSAYLGFQTSLEGWYGKGEVE